MSPEPAAAVEVEVLKGVMAGDRVEIVVVDEVVEDEGTEADEAGWEVEAKSKIDYRLNSISETVWVLLPDKRMNS